MVLSHLFSSISKALPLSHPAQPPLLLILHSEENLDIGADPGDKTLLLTLHSQTSLHHAFAHNRYPNWRIRARDSRRLAKAQSSSYRYTESSDDSHQFTSMFNPLVDKLQMQLGLIHPIPAPPINKSIFGFFVFFFFFGVVFDKLWTGRSRPSKPDVARLGIWPQVPTSFSLFLERDLRRKESVEWVNMVLGKLWKVYRSEIENWITGLLQPVIDDLKKPDYVQTVEIKQFSLGDEPLSVRNVEHRTSRLDVYIYDYLLKRNLQVSAKTSEGPHTEIGCGSGEAQERISRSLLQRAIRENKYKKCVHSAILQMRRRSG